MRRYGIVGVVLVCVMAAGIPVSSLSAEPAELGTLNLQIENDRFADTDRHYTNGLRVSYLSPADDMPGWVARIAGYLPAALFDPRGKKRYGLAFGQSIFTPEDISEPNLIVRERPYAGWLYGGVSLLSHTDTGLDLIEIDIGLVGPESFAEDVQTIVHERFGFTRPEGWDNQLRNEPAFAIFYERRWRRSGKLTALGLEADLAPYVAGSLGNVFTQGAGGATFRLGDDLPDDFGPPRIRPSLPGSGFFEPKDSFGWYLFAGTEGRVVLHNIFLDGNTFADSHHVDKRPLVGDFNVGVSLVFRHARLSYTHVFRTREFEGQRRADRFGAINLSFRY